MADNTDSTVTAHGSHRRTILKGAAWAAPVIVVATSAPAFASSPPMATVSVVPANIPTRGATTPVGPGIAFDTTILNDASSDPVTALVVRVVATLSSGVFGTVTEGYAPGFADAVVTGNDTEKTFSFVATSGLPIAPGSGLPFNATLTSNLPGGATGSFVVTPESTPSGPVTTGSGTF